MYLPFYGNKVFSIKHYLRHLMVLFFVLLPLPSAALESLEKVTLQLDWKYQFQFAGYIAAKEKGFYKEAGLDVELIEYQNGIDAVQEVLEQKTNFAVSNLSIFMQNKELVPIKLLATYFQKSPHIIVASADIQSPNDLIGKAIMISHSDLEGGSVAALFAHFFLNKDNITIVAPSFTIEDFIEKKVDAVSAYRTNEIFELEKRNIEYNIIDPADYGYASVTGNLYTSATEAKEHPERTRKFLHASNKGWAYALENQEELISIIFDKYSKKKSIENLRFEAVETKKLIQPDIIAIGSINQKSRLGFLKQLKRSSLLREDQELDVANEQSLFTAEQQDYLQNKKEITMCVTPEWMPFESINNGVHIGIVADVISLFKQRLPIPIRLIQTKDWGESLIKAENRTCDILSLAVKTPSRKSYLDFTKPYLDLPVVMATKNDTLFINDITEVKDKKLGIVKGYAMAEHLRLKIPGINIVDVASMHEGLAGVERGELFGYIDNLMVMGNALQHDFTGVLKVSARLADNSKLGIATRNDQPQLKEIFELLIQNTPTDELQTIYNKWVAIKQAPVVDYTLVWKLLAATVLLTLGYLFHYLKLKKLNDQLLILAITDKLTGLYNRVKTDEVIMQEKAILDRYGTEFSIILLDIDFFKHVNDSYGHLVGDNVLIEFAGIIKHSVRVTDYAGRWGGEEFLIICPNIGLDETTELAEKLLQKIRLHHFLEVGALTASAGVVQFSKQASIENTINSVDKMLYFSKENGRNQVTAYSEKN